MSQLKGIEKKRRQRDGSVNSVRSVNSGVGRIRRRSEEDDEMKNDIKAPRLAHSIQQSLLPKKQS